MPHPVRCWTNSAASMLDTSLPGTTKRPSSRSNLQIQSGVAMNKIIEQVEAEQITRQLPEFGPGDAVVVNVKVKEGNRERVQAFEGIVIAKRSRGLHSAFTVRKISHGTGVERVFQAHSPAIDSVQVK